MDVEILEPCEGTIVGIQKLSKNISDCYFHIQNIQLIANRILKLSGDEMSWQVQ